jgi:hypothetical protein
MLDFLGSGLLGSIFGGLFRLAPEVLKWLDRKNERAHELAMFREQCDLEAQRGSQKLAEIGAQRDMAVDVASLDAFKAAIDAQAEMAKAAGGWVAALSASVRPVITYWILAVWSSAHLWLTFNAWNAGMAPSETFRLIMSADFVALVSGTINFWFLDRTLAKRGL